MLSRFTAVSLIVPLVLVGTTAAVPRKAHANDVGKIIAAAAVGALVYGLLDHDECSCYHARCDGVPEYYRGPSRAYAYRRGYERGFRDGYAYGYRDGRWDGERVGYYRGYKRGYRDGRCDQWIEDVGCYSPPRRPVVTGPWPWF